MSRSPDMSTSNQYIKYYIEVIQNSQSVEGNTSNVTVKVWFYRTNSYESYGTGTVYCKINGTQYSAAVSPSQRITSTPIVLFNSTLNISHNSDGTKTLATSAWINIPSIVTSSEQVYSAGLTTIPRASSISSVTSSVSVDGSSQVTVAISRKSSSFVHTVKISFGSYSYTADNVATSLSYAIPTSWLNAIPNATNGTATVTVQTKSGSTNIGSAVSKSFTITVPSAYIPTFTSVTATPVNSTVPSDWEIYVQGKSQCRLVISGAASVYGATITGYSIVGGGFSGTTANYLTSVLPNFGQITFTAKVTDSRGRSSAAETVTITVEPYRNPTFSTMSTFRCTEDGTASDNGNYVNCTASFTYSSCAGNNSPTAVVYYRRSGTGGRSGETSLQSGVSLIIGGGQISEDYSFDVVYEIGDYFLATQTVVVIPTSFNTMDFKRGGRGIAFGKSSEIEHSVEISRNWMLFAPNITADGIVLNGIPLDYIVEQGTSGIWTYRKWDSGVAECWGSKTYSKTLTVAWGNLYSTGALGSVPYPFAFTDVPVESVTISNRSGPTCFLISEGAGNASKTQTADYSCARVTSYSTAYTIILNYHVIGRWK